MSKPEHYESEVDPIDALGYWGDKIEVIGFLRGNVIKYIARYRKKNGKEDLLKAKDYLERLIALEYPDE